MELDDKSYLKQLTHAVELASVNYDVWRTYNDPDHRPKYVNVMNAYLGFFSTSIHAHFVALIMPLYWLYETRDDTCNIPGLLGRLEKTRQSPSAILEEFRQKMNIARPLWIKVSMLRNNFFAHRTNELSVDRVFQDAKVSPNNLKELVELSKAIVNDLSQEIDRSINTFNLEAGSDTLRVLSRLADA